MLHCVFGTGANYCCAPAGLYDSQAVLASTFAGLD